MKRLLLALIVCVASIPSLGGATETLPEPLDATTEEVFEYRWRLGGLGGLLAGFFLPRQGDGRLSITPTDDGLLRSELLITSEKGDDGEYWRYGAEMDRELGIALRAWSSYRFRGETKQRQGTIDDPDVLDVATAIHALRRDPPDRPRRLEIWSDGKVYPVQVRSLGFEDRKVDGRKLRLRHLSVRGLREDGRRFWKGKLDLWLASDPAATPVEIHIERSAAVVRLTLTDASGIAAARTARR